MKKILLVCLLLTGCGRGWEGFKNEWKYSSPCKEGGRYTIVQNGYKIENTKCLYWATQDDDAIFEKNGHKIYVNGSSIIIQE